MFLMSVQTFPLVDVSVEARRGEKSPLCGLKGEISSSTLALPYSEGSTAFVAAAAGGERAARREAKPLSLSPSLSPCLSWLDAIADASRDTAAPSSSPSPSSPSNFESVVGGSRSTALLFLRPTGPRSKWSQ